MLVGPAKYQRAGSAIRSLTLATNYFVNECNFLVLTGLEEWAVSVLAPLSSKQSPDSGIEGKVH